MNSMYCRNMISLEDGSKKENLFIAMSVAYYFGNKYA